MQTFDALLRQAVSGFLASNLSLTEEAAGKAEKPEPTAPSSEGREARPSRRAGHDYNVNETGRQEAG